LIHRRRGYLSGAAKALMTELAAWPSQKAPARRSAGPSGRRTARPRLGKT
jgi:hypothetical protein